ncbi:MAG: FHA domain-containing protein [Planctomycetota bacterium]
MKLVVLAGAKTGSVLKLTKDRFTIGRSKECTLRAASDAISRRHCELEKTDDGLVARDLGSRNGTLVNGERIAGDRLLKTGDRLRIGPLEFRCELDTQAASAPTPAPVEAPPATADTGGIEESISDWLLGTPGAGVGETLSMSTDETREITERFAASQAENPAEEAGDGEEAESAEETAPKRPDFSAAAKQQAKDSREAAEQILREMARRR